MEKTPNIWEHERRQSRAGLLISRLLAKFRAPKKPTYHLYGDSAEGIRLPIDRKESDKLTDTVLDQYFEDQATREA